MFLGLIFLPKYMPEIADLRIYQIIPELLWIFALSSIAVLFIMCFLKIMMYVFFKRCLKIGFPNALGESVEVFGWFSVLLITSHLGGGYSDIQSMTQNIIIFLWIVSKTVKIERDRAIVFTLFF